MKTNLESDMLGCGVSETYKGSIHLALFALASICAAYNAGAALCRPSRRLQAQVIWYTALATWEAVQINMHWSPND